MWGDALLWKLPQEASIGDTLLLSDQYLQFGDLASVNRIDTLLVTGDSSTYYAGETIRQVTASGVVSTGVPGGRSLTCTFANNALVLYSEDFLATMHDFYDATYWRRLIKINGNKILSVSNHDCLAHQQVTNKMNDGNWWVTLNGREIFKASVSHKAKMIILNPLRPLTRQ
jgi:hypothetical protein